MARSFALFNAAQVDGWTIIHTTELGTGSLAAWFANTRPSTDVDV